MLTESVDDIVAELAPRLRGIVRQHAAGPAEAPPDLTLFERQVLDVLTDEPVHVDILADRASLATADTLVHLLSLEFKGLVRQLPGKMFARR